MQRMSYLVLFMTMLMLSACVDEATDVSDDKQNVSVNISGSMMYESSALSDVNIVVMRKDAESDTYETLTRITSLSDGTFSGSFDISEDQPLYLVVGKEDSNGVFITDLDMIEFYPTNTDLLIWEKSLWTIIPLRK